MTTRRQSGKREGKDLAFALPRNSEEEAHEDRDTARIVARVQAGDREAFARLYERYFERVYGYLRVMLADQGEAEDAAQHVFVKALAAMPSYRQRSQPFRAWLFRIARNHAIDQLRRMERLMPTDPNELRERQEEQEIGEEGLSILNLISDGDLMIFVERLPQPQRQALMLRYADDLSAAQIGELLGRSAADVRMLQSRGLRFLRARLNAVARRAERAGEDGDKIQMRRLPKEAPVIRSRKWSIWR